MVLIVEEQLRRSVNLAASDRYNAIILHGPSGTAGTLDLESKCIEGTIIASSVVDYRNFAHSSHNWINSFGDDSFVVAFVGPSEEALAHRTLDLIPNQIPRVEFSLGDDFAIAQVLSIYFSIQLAGWLGEVNDIDPGRPRIPAFGRELYHLRTRLTSSEKRCTPKQFVIERKVRAHGMLPVTDAQLKSWSRHYGQFRKRLNDASISAIVFDYDGTLVDATNRFEPPLPMLIQRVEELLKVGLRLGVATGRSDSLRDDLAEAIDPALHERILVGYNNASKVFGLDDQPSLDGDIDDPVLAKFAERRNNHTTFLAHMTVRPYPKHLSLRLTGVREIAAIWAKVHRLALEFPPTGDVSKLSLVFELSRRFDIQESSILCIGDSGRWPGNDAELLGRPLSLSVDRVSPYLLTC